MVTDFRISVSFRDNKKRVRIQRLLGAEGVLALVDLWSYVAENKPDGILTNMDDEDICIAANWSGDADKFIAAITDEKSRFLDTDDSTGWYVVHDWTEHNNFAATFEKRSTAAKKAINTRWSNEKRKSEEHKNESLNTETYEPYNDSNQSVLHDVSNRNTPIPTPIPIPTPKKTSSSRLSQQAEEIYQRYPKKEGKGAAIKAIQKALRDVPFEELEQAVEEYANSEHVRTTDRQFIPQPATWFNQRRWEDDRSGWHQPNGKAPPREKTVEDLLDETWRDPPPEVLEMEREIAERERQKQNQTALDGGTHS